jgi:hypothetical protein
VPESINKRPWKIGENSPKTLLKMRRLFRDSRCSAVNE